ncbi:alpha-tubulin N-acetyltransferase-like isoform X1 [Xenia sp. Carnegie-2017]|uniref:alpha-tubulin N-acetyltransferase-like isoform X1 n=1 Tax=Xenia sp. Carnegie-2017 TaxID=2897299 RepID=UPI001F03F918|nr:alpha-tubulin N-acetyltransferase-like isoform X1 [Xenia sp. Carnegie-2017]
MEFEFDVNKILPNPITYVDSKMCTFGKHARDAKLLNQHLHKIIDALGAASSKAQGLHTIITTASKLKYSDHELYILKDAASNKGQGTVIGIIKVGRKNLFLLDMHGVQHEVVPLCVMDFYVHHTKQRNGCGKMLFEHMLKIHNLQPFHVAIDRPSHKFLSFLKKHYGLYNAISQPNKFLVFDQFFRDMSAVGFVPRRSQRLKFGSEVKKDRSPVHHHRRTSRLASNNWPSTSQREQNLSAKGSSEKAQIMDVNGNNDSEISETPLSGLPSITRPTFGREQSTLLMGSDDIKGNRLNSGYNGRGLAAQASLYSRHNSADVAMQNRRESTPNQKWQRNTVSAGTRSLHACSDDNPLAVGMHHNNRFSTKDPIKGRLSTFNDGSVARPYGLSSTGNYTISSVVNTRHDVNLSNQCSSWNIFGIPRVETSPRRTKLDKARTLPF